MVSCLPYVSSTARLMYFVVPNQLEVLPEGHHVASEADQAQVLIEKKTMLSKFLLCGREIDLMMLVQISSRLMSLLSNIICVVKAGRSMKMLVASMRPCARYTDCVYCSSIRSPVIYRDMLCPTRRFIFHIWKFSQY